MVEVVTTWTPRPQHPKWRNDYITLLNAQRQTVQYFNHKYTIVTDDPLLANRPETVFIPLPESLMHAMIVGVIERLKRPIGEHIVFVDYDVLVASSLNNAFRDTFDLGLTHRINEKSPVNNGVMYVNKDGAAKALKFFEKALERCEEHWGGDQEAISCAAHPVPDEDCIEVRKDITIAFLNMRKYAAVPKVKDKRHDIRPYCVHFKGDIKDWMLSYFDNVIGVPSKWDSNGDR